MTVQRYDQFLERQLNALSGYISPAAGFHWPLIVHTAKETRNAITSFVETHLQREISVNSSEKNANERRNTITLADGTDGLDAFNRPHSRCSLRTVRSYLYKLARVIKPTWFTFDSSVTTIGTWSGQTMNSYGTAFHPFHRSPFVVSSSGGNIWDHWYISLSFWLNSFITGFHINGSGIKLVFSNEDQVRALTNGSLTSFINGPGTSRTSWSTMRNGMTTLMSLSQSIETLLELPELRVGVLCANYLKKIEGLLPDIIDYNIDLINESQQAKENITYYVNGKVRLINEFTRQELESLRILNVGRIRCTDALILENSYWEAAPRTYNIPQGLLNAFSNTNLP